MRKDATKLEVWAAYQADLKRWTEKQAHYIDIRPLTMNELIYIKLRLHPTAKAESKEVTRKLIEYIYEQKIVTAEEIYAALKLSDKPVLKRLKIFQETGLVRREGKKFYMASPRLEIIKGKYLERLCG